MNSYESKHPKALMRFVKFFPGQPCHKGGGD
jgi:hypothetical protein